MANNNRSGDVLQSLLVTLLPVTYLVVSVALLASLDVAVWQLWLSLALWVVVVGALHRSAGGLRLLVATCLVLGAALVALPLCEQFYDLFYDSRTYQASGFLSLSEGWNPFWEQSCCPAQADSPVPAHPLLAESYPKGAWLLSALLIELTGSLQSTFLIQLLALAAAAILCWSWLQLEWESRGPGLRLAACLALAFNPIALVQLFSHYVDGLVASILLCWFLSSWLFLRTGRSPFLVQSLLLIPLALNLKFTVVAYLGVLGATLFLAVRRGASDIGNLHSSSKADSLDVSGLGGSCPKQWLISSVAAGLLGLLLFGWNPYVSNSLQHGNPLYPAIGYKDSEHAVADAADRSFTERNILSKVLIANFSVPSEADPRTPRLASPVRLDFPPGVDHRFSGFGPSFGAVLILALAAWMLEWLTGLFNKLKKGQVVLSDNLSEQRAAGILFCGLLLSVLITDAGWWARLAPQLWWIPAFVVVSLSRTWARRLGTLVLALALGNAGLVVWGGLGSQYRASRELAAQLRAPAAGYVLESESELFANYSWHLLREERPDVERVSSCPEEPRPVKFAFYRGWLSVARSQGSGRRHRHRLPAPDDNLLGDALYSGGMSGLWRLAIVYSAIAAFTCFGLYNLTASWHLRHDREALLGELERVGAALLAGAEAGSSQSFTEITEKAAGSPYRLTLIGEQGEVLADSWFEGAEDSRLNTVSGRPEVVQARQEGSGEAFRFSTVVGEEMAFRAFQLPDSNLIFRIGRTYRPNQIREHQIRWSFVFGGVLLVGAVLLLIRSTQQQWNKSAQILIEGSKQIAGGEFPQRLPLVTLRPMGKVARALENLAAMTRTRIERLEGERDHLSTVLSSMLEGVLVIDRRGRISDSNPAFREMFQVQSPPRGKLPLEVIRVASVSDQISQVLSSGETAWDEIRSEGRVLRVHFTPVGSDPTTGVVVVFNDITDLRRLEQLRKEFVSNVSHELKTPLTAIQGYAETLSEESKTDPLHRQFLDKMVRNSRQLSNMIDQLLNLARIESQSYELALETLDFSEVVAQLQEEFGEILKEKRLEFSWSAPEDLLLVADRSYLYQVFRNLLENAIKYTQKGKISLRMQEGDGQWLFSVEDTGSGIPEADLERIFERFYRVHKDRSRETGGSGIGLAIVKHIVQLHQGEVWAESRLNTGSRLCFTIPFAKS